MNLNDLISRPYKTNGRGPAGFDCWGLVLEVARRAGVEMPELIVPEDEKGRADMVGLQKRENFLRLEGPEAYCVVLFRIIDDNSMIKWHVGIVLECCGRFVHTTGKMGVNISRLDDPKWRLHIEGFYKFKI